MKKMILTLMLIMGLACPAAAAEKPRIKLVYVEWACATASTYLAKEILETKLGYDVEVIATTLPMIAMSLASGDADATLTLWLPETHKNEYAKIRDKTEMLGELAAGAKLGLVVPDYVPLKSIEELKAHADKFDKSIIGIDPGAGIMGLTENAMKAYELPMTLVDGSDATMTAVLGDAIRRQEWVVVTGWSPHWKFGRWNLHYLEDPKNVFGGGETVHILGRKGLKEDHPKVWQLFKRMRYTDMKQFETYINWGTEAGMTPEKSAKKFLETYPDVVKTWLE